jgi:uncharacterized protein (DUF885 family)
MLAPVWSGSLREDPLTGTGEGVHTYDDRLPAVTPADQRRQLQADQVSLGRLRAIDRSGLTSQEAVSDELFDFMLSQRLALAAHREWRAPLNGDTLFTLRFRYGRGELCGYGTQVIALVTEPPAPNTFSHTDRSLMPTRPLPS